MRSMAALLSLAMRAWAWCRAAVCSCTSLMTGSPSSDGGTETSTADGAAMCNEEETVEVTEELATGVDGAAACDEEEDEETTVWVVLEEEEAVLAGVEDATTL
jgi:hypothetical protein